MSQAWVVDTAERYRLDRPIATGGMGEVWQGTDTVLGRQVAVKVLKREYADDDVFRSRFRAEARHAAALQHPNVASVFDYGETREPDGGSRPFLVMELVPGQPLSSLLRPGEPMTPDRAAALAGGAAEALAEAHRLGIVHRDVKPSNLLVTPEGRVKVTDFGIARAAGHVPLTQTGQIVGTPHYLSPEQAEGQVATPASDIYALGVVLFECLAGRRPFQGDSPAGTAFAHLMQPPPELPPEVPERLRRVVRTAMAKDPADRYASAADMATALRGGTPGGPTHVPPVTAPAGREETRVLTPPPSRGSRRPGWLPWAAVAAVVAFVVALISLLGGGSQPTHATKPPPSPSRSTRPSASPRLTRVRLADYLGRPAGAAQDALQRRGFVVRASTVDNPGGEPGGTVAGVRPHGLVAPGRTLTLLVWAPPPPPSEHGGHGEGGPKPPHDHDHEHGKAKGKKKP